MKVKGGKSMITLDYQQIIDLVAQAVSIAMVPAVIFALTQKVFRLFMSLAFGKDHVTL